MIFWGMLSDRFYSDWVPLNSWRHISYLNLLQLPKTLAPFYPSCLLNGENQPWLLMNFPKTLSSPKMKFRDTRKVRAGNWIEHHCLCEFARKVKLGGYRLRWSQFDWNETWFWGFLLRDLVTMPFRQVTIFSHREKLRFLSLTLMLEVIILFSAWGKK